MRLDGVYAQSASGLDSVAKQLAVVGQNVANANTPGYVRESVALTSVTAAGDGLGVRTGVATRTLDQVLQAGVFAAGGQAAGERLRNQTLAAVDAASGAPGSGQDLASLVGNLRDAYSTLSSDPSNPTQQRAVVNQAGALAAGLNGISRAVADARQAVQDGLGDDVGRANAGLRQLGELSDQIIRARARGESTADLEDQRDTAAQTVSELTGAKYLQQSNGDLLAVTGGIVLPLRAGVGPLSVGTATLGPGSAAPPLLLNGAPVSLGAAGGRIGAAIALRDTTLPDLQAGVDGFALNLAQGFASAGLALFTAPGGAVPVAATGSAHAIQVSDAVAADPTLVRDGAGGPGPAGSAALVTTVLNTVLATGSGTIAGQATTLVARHADLAGQSARRLETEQAVHASLTAKLAAGTAVSVDKELATMVRLQNAYAANAKVLSAVQAMFTELLDSVR